MARATGLNCNGGRPGSPRRHLDSTTMLLRWLTRTSTPLFLLLLSACLTMWPRVAACAAELSPAHLQADLAWLRTELAAAHFDLHARRPRAEMDAAFARAQRALDRPMSAQQALLHFQRFVAAGRVAHARIDLPFERWAAYRDAGGRALPLSFRVHEGRVFVWDAPVPVAGLAAGDEVLAIDGQPALKWLATLGELVSADSDYLLHAQMEGMVPVLTWLVHGDLKGVRLTLGPRGRVGSKRSVFVPSRTRAELEAALAQTAPTAAPPPSRELRLLDGGVAYLRPGPFYDDRPEAQTPWDLSAYRAFIDQSFASILAAGSTDLLIDLRNNPGGDNSFSDLMVAWVAKQPFRFSPGFEIKVSAATVASNQARLNQLPADAGGASADMAALFKGKRMGEVVVYAIPEVPPRPGPRFTGRVHVLVNRHSYSNAASVAAVIQDYGFGRVVGEETADLASTLGAMEHFTLPHSGLVVGYPKARILRPSGDPTPRGVQPDVTLPTPRSKEAGDPVLDAALALLRAEARQRR